MSPHAGRRSLLLGLAGGAALAAACRGKGPAETPEVVVLAARGRLPAAPGDEAWSDVPVHVARLLLQDMVEPRLLSASTPDVRVQALTDGTRVAFRLSWKDEKADDVSAPARFADACAVQLPAKSAPDLPAPQMGEPGRPVEITMWRACWQAWADGRGDSIRDLHPRAAPDHYPFEAAALRPGSEDQRAMALRYAPARALGNDMAGPRTNPVQDLSAEGPGTLTPAPGRGSTGRGVRSDEGWAVLITRPLPAGLAPGGRTQVAFAVWQGSREEVGARKMRSGWIPLKLEARS